MNKVTTGTEQRIRLKGAYKVCNGTFYSAGTNDSVIEVLERCRVERIRIVVDYGDVTTGKSWGERYGVKGYIGRTTGDIKSPILVYNARSLGGGLILSECILSIKTTRLGVLLYSLAK